MLSKGDAVLGKCRDPEGVQGRVCRDPGEGVQGRVSRDPEGVLGTAEAPQHMCIRTMTRLSREKLGRWCVLE